MATLELCDLCNGKIKQEFFYIKLQGKLTLIDGEVPPPPEGFKYVEDSNRKGEGIVKSWDSFGNYLGQVQFVRKPEKEKKVSINYEVCESCAQKLMNMLETLRRHYHLESKKIEFIGGEQIGFRSLFDKFLELDDEEE